MSTKPNDTQLYEALDSCPQLLFNAYLNQLATYPICPYPYKDLVCQLSCVTLANPSLPSTTLAILLRALYSIQLPLLWLVHVSPEGKRLSLCSPSIDYNELTTSILSQHLTQASIPFTQEVIDLGSLCTPYELTSITSASFYLSPTSTHAIFKQLYSLLHPIPYTLLFLIEPMCFTTCNQHLVRLHELYNTLYLYQEFNYTQTCQLNNSHTNVALHSKATTENYTEGLDETKGCSHTDTTSNRDTKKILINSQETLKSELATECSSSKSNTHNHSSTTKEGTSYQDACKEDSTDTASSSAGDTLVTNYRRIIIQTPQLLDTCKHHLTCYDLNAPMFAIAGYFLGNTPATTLNGGSTLLHLLSSKSSCPMPSSLNTWTHHSPSFDTLLTYLTQGKHPLFAPSSCTSPKTPALPCCLDTLVHFLS